MIKTGDQIVFAGYLDLVLPKNHSSSRLLFGCFPYRLRKNTYAEYAINKYFST
ncbi:hypothetical protein SAMN02745165_01371 [Malonomonas rubra DSM 5091]|uniref:Uncharacterized protein n=1 Tax=Malonomonas rubra DSM 5091 TaxID=1122189 RepID=A0A1M6G233_MALRU|nr:hypothetical protein SAMN02745165_01371 [Malonomonas rubra DSM 5091]